MTAPHLTPEETARIWMQEEGRFMYGEFTEGDVVSLASILCIERRAAFRWVLDLYGYDFPCTHYHASKCSHENWASCLRHAIEAEMKG